MASSERMEDINGSLSAYSQIPFGLLLNANFSVNATSQWLSPTPTQANIPSFLSSGTVICLAIIICIIMVLTIGGNSMVILTIIRHKSMRTRTNMFITNLAVSDILVAVFDMPVSLITLLQGKWVLGEEFCQFNGFTSALFLIASIHTLMYISIHKYISITRPFSRFMTPRRILFMIAGIWVWSMSYALAAVLGWNPSVHKPGATQCGPSIPNNMVKMSHSLVNTLFNFLVPLFVLIFCYFHIFREIRKHMARMRETSNMDMKNTLSQQKRIAVTLFTVMACFLICLTPYIGYSTSAAFMQDKNRVPLILNPVAYWCVYANSACNPIIYAFRSPSFRQGYKEIVCGRSSTYYSGAGEDSPRSGHQNWVGGSFRRSSHGSRKQSTTSWRSVSFMGGWRSYKEPRRTSSLGSKSSCKVSAQSSSRKNGITDNNSNGSNFHQRCFSPPVPMARGRINTITERSCEDEPSCIETSSICRACDEEEDTNAFDAARCDFSEETHDDDSNDVADSRSHSRELQISPISNDLKHAICHKSDDSGPIPADGDTAAVEIDDDDDAAFYDSDAEQEMQMRENCKKYKRPFAKSCYAHSRPKDINAEGVAAAQVPMIDCPSDSDEHENPSLTTTPITKSHSWSDLRRTPKNPDQSHDSKRRKPAPFLWQPSVDYLDVPRRVLQDHGISRQSHGDLTAGLHLSAVPFTKRLSSSFRALFRKSQEKSLKGSQEIRESSENVQAA